MQDSKPKVMTCQETKKKWNGYAEFYTQTHSAPQSFYFTLISMLDLPHSTNILQVGCGAGLMLPYALQIKNKDAKYLATDLSQKMTELTHKRIVDDLQKHHSTITVQEWLKRNGLTIRSTNGEQPFGQSQKFDRIVCNMVMMLTENADKMLANFYNEAKSGCLLGVSVWGDKARTYKYSLLQQAMQQNGVDTSTKRSNFHLYKKLGEMAEKVGWKVVVQWEQVSVFPYLTVQEVEAFADYTLGEMPFPEPKKNAIKKSFLERVTKKFEEKQPLLFSAELYIFKKE